MTDLITHLQNWTAQQKLMGYDNHDFYQLVQAYIKQLDLLKYPLENKVVVADKDPNKFIAAFLACIITEIHVFLGNPDWKESEWQQVFELVQPDLILGLEENWVTANTLIKRRLTKQSKNLIKNQIMIPTGGSSGKIKFTIHTWETLRNSVRGFQQYFELETVNSFCLLPLYHVSGLMQFLRSFLTFGKFLILPYSTFKNNSALTFEYQSFFISLVPKQLQFFLENNPEGLAQFQTVLLGGASAWPDLLEQARKKGIRLALTYGMTETASQIVALKADNFLSGNNTVGQVLPHAQLMICDELGQALPINQMGIITLQASSLFLGYYPEFNHSNSFQTDDLGYLDEQQYLHIIGRNSQKIITGGENVFPAEVEAVILATQLVKDVIVIGLPDSQWGEMVTAIYTPHTADNFNLESLKIILRSQLSGYKCPKQWLRIDEIPRSRQGKINYQWLREYAQRELEKSGNSSF